MTSPRVIEALAFAGRERRFPADWNEILDEPFVVGGRVMRFGDASPADLRQFADEQRRETARRLS